MIIADEWLLTAMLGVGTFIGYLTRTLMFDIKESLNNNTSAIAALTAIIQRCDRK